MRKTFSILLGLLFCVSIGFAQSKDDAKLAKIEGVVLDATNHDEPVGFATVQIQPQGMYTTTDFDGTFEFKNLEPGKLSLNIQFVGMETIDTTLTLTPGKVHQLVFKMKETSFRLEEVTVSATANKAGQATASNISRQAMDHLQANSLKDIMQLLPGGSIENSNMAQVNNLYIRTLTEGPASSRSSQSSATSNSNANMNSLGTAIISDGAPLSNNANMQALAPTVGSATSAVGGGTSPAAGIDLRTISTDNIESVEVIRGIPSAEYGDLTSGAVIIKSKAGKEPLNVRLKINPYTYAASASKGFGLGKKGGTMNISGDYTYDVTQQIESHVYYQRLGLRAMWSKTFGSDFTTNNSLNFNYREDTRKKNPDDASSRLATGAKEVGFRFNSNGTLNTPNAGWLKNIRYSLAFSYTDKHSFREQVNSNVLAPYLMSLTDGAILSNRPNQKVYDNEGNEITNIPNGESGYIATYLPYEYFGRYDIYGKELNLYAKVTSNFNKRWENNNNKILFGIDYKMDGNLGDGTVYDFNTPPIASASKSNSAYRPRKFSDIPFINQLGIFLEDSYTHSFGDRELKLTAGLRFDYINKMTALSPRFNMSFDIIPNTLVVRGGYGLLAKAPTSMYLYPQDAYFDYVNYNNIGDENFTADEQLVLGTTRVFKSENPNLKIAKNEKSEIGFDWRFTKNRRMRLSVTAYYEKLRNGYTMGKDLDYCFNLVPYYRYSVFERNEGSVPTLQLANQYNVFAMFNTPMNTISSTNKGLEYELDFGRIDAIRTSFLINGAWMQTKYTDNNYSYSTQTNGNEIEHHIGVYDRGVETYCREKLNTTFRITHNIPKIGFAVTLTTQVDWKHKTWTEYGNDTMFIKYISYKDGKVYDFDPSKKDDPEFAYLFEPKSDTRFIAESYMPTVLFNILVSKEIGDMLTASFFVNNLFNSRPLYESIAHPGSFRELGIPTFFGFDLKINIR